MPACGGDLHGPLGLLLALDITEIDGVIPRRVTGRRKLAGDSRDVLRPIEEVHQVAEEGHGDHLETLHQGRLARIVRRHDQALQLLLPGHEGRWQDPLHALHAAVQGKLPHDQVVPEPLALDEPFGRQDPQGDGQIETGPFLADVGRSEIHGNPVFGKAVTGILHGRLDAVAALLDGRIGQAHR